MVNVTYSGNKAVFEGIMLSVLSMIKHTKDSLHLYILTMDLSEQDPRFVPISQNQIDILNKVIRGVNEESVAELIDVTAQYFEDLKSGKNKKNGYTPYCMIRLFLDELPQIPNKIIHLDVDTMITRDINELFSIDISNHEYGAVKDHMGQVFINRRYINSGVLLLNMERIRKTKLFQRARIMSKKRKMIMPDQSAINKLAEAKLILPRKFNEQRTIKEETVVKHFCKAIKFYPLFFYLYNYKQWQRDKVHEKLKIFDFDDIYMQYDALAKIYDMNK